MSRAFSTCALLLGLAAAVGGCSSDGTYLLLHLGGTTEQPVTRFDVQLTHGSQHAAATFPLATAVALPPEQQLSLTLSDHPTGDIAVTVTAQFAGGGSATAGGTAHVSGRGTTALTLVFGGPISGDGGVDGGDSDGGDLATPPDLTAPPDLTSSVPAASFAVTPSATAVLEHASFTLHLVAKNASGQPETGYQGTVALTSSWGDVTPTAPPVFTNGVCDIDVDLNRETHAGYAGAFITATDGAATGTSPEITVSIGDWKVDGSKIRLIRTYTKSTMTLGESLHPGAVITAPAGGYRLIADTTIHMGGPTGNPYFVVYSSTDGLDWGSNSTGGFAAGAMAASGVSSTSILWDGTQYRALYTGADGSSPSVSHLLGAMSPDGVSWTAETPVAAGAFQCSGNPVAFLYGSGAYTRIQGSCSVNGSGTSTMLSNITNSGAPWAGYVKDGTTSKLWAISGGKTYYYTSADGISWVASATVWPVPVYAVYWNKERSLYEGFIDQDGNQSYYRAFRD